MDDKLSIVTRMLVNRCTPDNITFLEQNEVLVFGTNPAGEHKSTAARLAVKKFGAHPGLSFGMAGQTFAIPVHRFKHNKMVAAVDGFIQFASQNPQLTFFVLSIGCGSAGMDPAFIALMFRNAIDLPNVYLTKEFINELRQYYAIGVDISEDCKTIIRFPMDYEGKYKIPLGVECIGESAFMGCCGCDLQLPNSIKRIEKWAFCDMGVIGRSLLIPRSVEFIDNQAFESEWFSPIMAVFHNSYAYSWARMHNQRYECVDFDEAADMKRRLGEVSCARQKNRDGVETYFIANPSYKKEDLIIGKEWVFVRTVDGVMRFVCGKAESDFILEVCNWKDVVSAAAGFHEIFAVLASGDVVCASNRKRECEKRIDAPNANYDIHASFAAGYLDWCRSATNWRDVKSIVACEGRVAVLTHGGTILSVSDQTGYEKPEDYDRQLAQMGLGKVKNLSVGWLHAAVLDDSGRVSVVGAGEYCNAGNVSDWHNVISIDVFSCYFSPIQTVGLRSDGKVLHTLDCQEIDNWEKIRMVSCLGSSAVAALDDEGNILIAGSGRYDTIREEISCWPRMSVVRGGYNMLVGVDLSGGIWVVGISRKE